MNSSKFSRNTKTSKSSTSQNSETESPRGKISLSTSTMIPSSNSSESICDNKELNKSNDMTLSSESTTSAMSTTSNEDTNKNIEQKLDPLEISRYPLRNPIDITITKMQEIKLQQKLLKELKFIQSFDEKVLRDQGYYWLFTNNIVNEDARLRIKSSLEIYCMMPMQWISGTELEIDINPSHRIEKVSKKKG